MTPIIKPLQWHAGLLAGHIYAKSLRDKPRPGNHELPLREAFFNCKTLPELKENK